MQELDAARRLAILRGETPPPLPEPSTKADDEKERRKAQLHGLPREKRKRKRAGENDTDFEMRVAAEQVAAPSVERQVMLRKSTVDAPLVDQKGHIDLFPQERPKQFEKNDEAEKEAAKKKKEYEDQYTMRFSNAAGFKQSLENPWYSKTGSSKEEVAEMPGTDVWGNEDPRRGEREAARVVNNDPLAIMRQGAAQARQVAKERKKWIEEKEREMAGLAAKEKRRRKHKRRHKDDELENFSLDNTEQDSSRRRDNDKERRERKHRHRHRGSRPEEESRHRNRDTYHKREY